MKVKKERYTRNKKEENEVCLKKYKKEIYLIEKDACLHEKKGLYEKEKKKEIHLEEKKNLCR